MSWRGLAVVVACAAVVPYLPSLDNYFIQDDFGVVSLLASKPATYFPQWFVSTWMDGIWGYTPDEIRPFPALTYQVAARFGAASPYPNHVINIAFHAVNALLVLLVARRAAGLAAGPAAFAALVFALLPMQTESVAWITGRVDSMPACFFMAALVLFVRWRAEHRARDYWWSVGWCFVALFTKQNAVILAPCLVAYDLLVAGRPLRPTWQWARPYVPFAALTAAYLGLRYVLFGEVARESMLTAAHFEVFLIDLATHLKRMVYGEPGVAMSGVRLAGIVAAVAVGTTMLATALVGRAARPLLGVAAFFGVVWVGLCVAPTLVAGYASPRHMYLASVGWAVLIAMPLEVAWRGERPALRWAVAAAAAWLLAAYAVQLHREVALWDVRAHVAERTVRDVEAEARATPPGTLVIVGAPRRSFAYAVPHAFRPPFTASDLPARLRLVMHSSLYCCPVNFWEPDTRAALRAWLDDATAPPVVVLSWDRDTGAVSRADSVTEPFLRSLGPLLLESRDVATLDRLLLDIVNKLAPQPRTP